MSDDNLKAYFGQILKIKQTQGSISDDEVQKIALELGFSNADLLEVENAFDASLIRGRGFMKFKDWHNAIKELEYDIILKPNNVVALQALALCYTYNTLGNDIKKRPKTLTKSRTDKKISGVLGGIAHFIGINPLILRMAVLIIFFTSGLVVIGYFILALLMDKEPEHFDNQ